MNPSPLPSPHGADLEQAPSTFPDGPNVGPSAHELEAARGQIQKPVPSSADGAQGQDSDESPDDSPDSDQVSHNG